MPEEMLSFPAGGSTPRLTKPVAYDTIGAPKSEVRRIVGAKATLPTSGRLVQRSSTWFLDVAMARSVRGRKLWRLCAEGGKRYTQTLYLKVWGLVAESREVYRMKNHRLKNPRCMGICPWVLW